MSAMTAQSSNKRKAAEPSAFSSTQSSHAVRYHEDFTLLDGGGIKDLILIYMAALPWGSDSVN
jgi:hypothetical protein